MGFPPETLPLGLTVEVVRALRANGVPVERVAALVELHVPAKRYLVTVDPAYREELSDGSAVSLARQGDVLSHDERAALERNPQLRDATALRRCDERAKVPGLDVGGLARWRPVVERVAQP